MKFEDMKSDRKAAVTKVAEFLGCTLGASTTDTIVSLTSFENMKKADTRTGKFRRPGAQPHMRKGVVGDWKNYFSNEQSARMEAEYDKQLAGTGLAFRFE